MADYYGTAQGFKAYHIARGRPEVDDFDDAEEITPSLLRCSEFLDGKYALSFPGIKIGGRAQVREWPRSGGVDRNGYPIPMTGIPTEVEYATYELMYRDIKAPGSLLTDYTPNAYESASVDGAVSVTFAKFGSAHDVQVQLPIVDRILAPILTGSGSGNLSSLSGGNSRV